MKNLVNKLNMNESFEKKLETIAKITNTIPVKKYLSIIAEKTKPEEYGKTTFNGIEDQAYSIFELSKEIDEKTKATKSVSLTIEDKIYLIKGLQYFVKEAFDLTSNNNNISVKYSYERLYINGKKFNSSNEIIFTFDKKNELETVLSTKQYPQNNKVKEEVKSYSKNEIKKLLQNKKVKNEDYHF